MSLTFPHLGHMSLDLQQIESTYIENFTRYVKIPTASNPDNVENQPSTEEQWALAKILKKELEDLGVQDVELDEHCYVYGYVNAQNKKERVVLLAHMDVSPDAPSVGVNPIIHHFDGNPIKLKNDVEIPLRQLEGIEKGQKIITTDGTTLLGGDDKAGVAIITTFLKHVKVTPDMPSICICFTPDEEIGNGVGHIRVDKLTSGIEGAYGITVDGCRGGEIVFETFSAYGFDICLKGVVIHPGYAYNKMINSIKYASELVGVITGKFKSAEQSKGTESYILVNSMTGEIAESHVKGIIRTFDNSEMEKLCKELEETVKDYAGKHKEIEIDIKIKFQYKNMREKIPESLINKMMEVGKEFNAYTKPIRGGTDGSRLSQMGLPTPDLWNGTDNFHSIREFNVVKEAVDAVVYLQRLLTHK